MDSLRFYALAAGLFLTTFAGGVWFLTPRPAPPAQSAMTAQAPVTPPPEQPKAPKGMVPLQPDPRLPTFHRVDPDDPRTKLEQSSVSDDDPVRDRLRNEVLDYAKALGDDPCNEVLKKHYINAVVAYARAWIAIVPCIGTQTCRGADSPLLDRGAHAFGSPLDHRVRDAMRAAHQKALFGSADFPKDTLHLVADLAADSSLNGVHETREFRRVSAQLDDASTRRDCGH